MPKVTIILPCYNVAEYLPKALDSLIEQMLKDIEIIPVDDGSPDNCKEIISNYAKKDNRIKAIFQKNKGYGGAVNAGLKKATGSYIAILEPDDYVSENYYGMLYNIAFRDDLDVCGASSYCEVRDHLRPRLVHSWYSGSNGLLTQSQINSYLLSGMPGITLKIYRRNFILENKLFFDESISVYLDVYFVTLILLLKPKMKIIRGIGYYYRKGHIGQSTSNPNVFHNIVKLVDITLNKALTTNCSQEQFMALVSSMVIHLVSYCKKSEARNLDSLSSFLLEKIYKLINKYEELTLHKRTFNFLKSRNKHLTLSKSRVINEYIFKVSDFKFQGMDSLKVRNISFSELFMEVEFFAVYVTMIDDKNLIQSVVQNVVQFIINFRGCKSKPLIDFSRWVLYCKEVDAMEMMNRNILHFTILNWYLYLYHCKENIELLAESASLTNNCRVMCSTIPQMAYNLPIYLKSFSSDMRMASVVWGRMKSNEADFEQYIQGKTIAVVGNAPSEVGLRLGKEIDEHDIVIRFNHYSIGSEFLEDYGCKESIWAVTPGFDDILSGSKLYQLEYIIFPMVNVFINTPRLVFLYKLLLSGVKVFGFDSFKTRFSNDIIVPSVGLYVLSFLLEHKHLLKNIHLYGFSSVKYSGDDRHYFKGDPTKSENIWPHEWDRESSIIETLKQELSEYYGVYL